MTQVPLYRRGARRWPRPPSSASAPRSPRTRRTTASTRPGPTWSIGQEPILTDKQFAMLNNLAFQAAVTKICDGYELDQNKFADGRVRRDLRRRREADTPTR